MLPSAVIVFPIVYIINDVMTECFGIKNASKTIMLAFSINLLCVVFFNIAIQLPTTQDFSSYSIVLGNTLKALLASFVAYLSGSFVNAGIMHIMKNKTEKYLMLRCVISTLFGEGIDALIFISVMFIGVLPVKVVSTMIITQALFKTIYEVVVYPVTRRVIKQINK
jgi:uncharacterized integral membrane protein (TIGR00697 family)